MLETRWYEKFHLFLSAGLRGKAEQNKMNLWDEVRYFLFLKLPFPRIKSNK